MVKIVAFAFKNTLFDENTSTLYTPQKLRDCLEAFHKKNVHIVIVSNMLGGPSIFGALDQGIGEMRKFLGEADIYTFEKIERVDPMRRTFKPGFSKAQVLDLVLEEYNIKHPNDTARKEDVCYTDVAGKDYNYALHAGYSAYVVKTINNNGLTRPVDDYLDFLYFGFFGEKFPEKLGKRASPSYQINEDRDIVNPAAVPTTLYGAKVDAPQNVIERSDAPADGERKQLLNATQTNEKKSCGSACKMS